MKKFTNYLKENNETSDYSELLNEVRQMIEETIETSGGEFNAFIEEYLQNDNDVKIQGLINDSDIYEFYLKWKNEIDEILSESKHFNKTPAEFNTFGIYEYLVESTLESISIVVKKLQ